MGKVDHTVHVSDVVPTVSFYEPAAKKPRMDGENVWPGSSSSSSPHAPASAKAGAICTAWQHSCSLCVSINTCISPCQLQQQIFLQQVASVDPAIVSAAVNLQLFSPTPTTTTWQWACAVWTCSLPSASEWHWLCWTVTQMSVLLWTVTQTSVLLRCRWGGGSSIAAPV
jgi:hypothetical protein